MAANNKSFTSEQMIGNQSALVWTENKVKEVFDCMIKNTIEDTNIVSLQDAILSVGLYSSSVNYLVNKYPVFKTLKNDIHDIIISRINKKALLGERAGGYSASASIWRMKQCGEKDNEVVNKNINYNSEELSEEKIKDISSKLESEY